MAAETLSQADAKRFYDRFGAKQDQQGWYEDAAVDSLIRASRFFEASAVVELGCGTGRIAERLLDDHLPSTAVYTGIDISETMCRLASDRLERFGDRVTVRLHETDEVPPLTPGSADRIVSTYVLDLLPDPGIRDAMRWAFDTPQPDGLLCLAGITHGTGPISRVVMGLWRLAFRLNPRWVGGCRPVNVGATLQPDLWAIEHHEVVVAWGIASEILVARHQGANYPR